MTRKRELKGIALLMKGAVRQVDPSNFLVRSQTDPNVWYEVRWQRNRWVCNCRDFERSPKKCKHMYAVGYYLKLRDISLGVRSLGQEDEPKCPKCGSADVIRRGFRYNKRGPVQRYLCKSCGFGFSGMMAFRGTRHKAEVIVEALDLYYRGLSLRQIAEHLDATRGVRVSYGTVYSWIRKYVELVNRFTSALQAKVSERWHADETILRVKGRDLVVWGLLDSETRLLIATHISERRGKEDAQSLISRGLERSQNKPSELVTDGLPSYKAALDRISAKGDPLVHLQGPLTESLNNRMERLWGTLKARAKTMCTFRSEESARRFIEGFATYYNFIKPHRSLNGKTPAEASGISRRKLNWMDLISASEKCGAA
jgi:putative transposase